MQRQVFRIASLVIALTIALGITWGIPTPALAFPAPVQTFYVTLPEADALTVLDTINSAANSPVTTYFSIAVGVSGTYVYYDQWENGYDSDIANPTNLYSAGNLGGTQIWGNSLAADGCPPNKAGVTLTCTNGNDVLNAGDVIIPSNSVPIPRNSTTILFDGKDKIGASSSIAMARATWPGPDSVGTLFAFAHEIYATAEWGVAYESPVGTNTVNAGSMFEYSALSIMASQNNTTVQIDANANGAYETTVTLNEGGSTLVTGILQGAKVLSDKPVQVVLLTGDINGSPGYESRDMNLLPVSAYGSSYWSPVGVSTDNDGTFTTGPTRLFLYNPSINGSIYITCERYSVANTTSTLIAPRGVWTINLVDGQGARCYASNNTGSATGEPIFAIGTVDTDDGANPSSGGQIWDWSFTLFPDNFLSTDALIGLGLGRDPTSGTSPTQNGSPLWVTSACSSGGTYVYVDWDNNGTANTVDTNGDGTAESGTQNGILVNRLQSVMLFQPSPRDDPYDQSGARVWSRTAPNLPQRTDGTPGCNLALAWGEDPRRASAAAPGLDVGTSIPPLRLIEGTKSLTVATDTAPIGVLNPGDTVTYNITVKNSGSVVVNNVRVYDTVPANTSYVTVTTQKDLTSNAGTGPWVSIPDDGSGTAFPLDVTGGVLLGNLNPGWTFYVRFNVTLLTGDYEEISNCDTVTTAAGEFVRCVTTPVATRDWGDLPDSYGTSAAAGGPRHSSSGLRLGSNWDIEAQGNPTGDARGDDATLSPDDEDGISPVAWTNANTGNFGVTVTGGSGCLNAWMDFTNGTTVGQDGDFNDTYTGGYSERIVNNLSVSAGTSNVPFSVPTGVLPTSGGNVSYYFRFRLSPSPCGTIASTGFVLGGEVEDYQFTYSPLAVTLAEFSAVQQGDFVLLTWETNSELNNRGFNLYRGTSEAAPDRQLNMTLIPSQSQGNPGGFIYTWEDRADLVPGATYFYWIEDVDIYGVATRNGPVSVVFTVPTAVTLNSMEASPVAGGTLPVAGAMLALMAPLAGALLLRRRRA